MSVIRFDGQFIGKLCKTVMMNNPLKEAFRTYDDYFTIQQYYDNDKNKFYDSHIPSFFNRLYIANQAVSILQYGQHKDEPREIELLTDEECESSGYFGDFKEFLKELNSLQYNLISNGGNGFTQEKDVDALQRIVDAVKDILLGQKGMVQ